MFGRVYGIMIPSKAVSTRYINRNEAQEAETMTIQEMKARKKKLGYSNAKVAELSGVPLGTVQKIFSGATASPRYETIRALEKVLAEDIEAQYTASAAAFLQTALKATLGPILRNVLKPFLQEKLTVHRSCGNRQCRILPEVRELIR